MRRFLSVAVLAAAFAGTTAGLAHAQDDPSNFTLPAPACESGNCAVANGQGGNGQPGNAQSSNGQDGYGQDGVAHAVATDEGSGQ
ncbi:hypothetical protein [Saccharopolyspora shandongensis]|uniref:hypothetical protein n=1 Tax=Saccharopolyspora shandongensis TaxID=418495 RepID=UPI0033DCB8A0